MTTVVGSYPQPTWLVDKALLRGQRVPRVEIDGLWRVGAEARDEAIGDATRIAISEMERAGIDVITDGETCRGSYTNHFAASLDGLDHDRPATKLDRLGREIRVFRVVGPIRHRFPVELKWAQVLRATTRRLTKVTLPGPFTLAQQVKDEYYGDHETLAMQFAAAVNQEALLLQQSGIDVIQLDEPWLRNDPSAANRYGVKAIDRALAGLNVRTAVHICFGYAFLRPGVKPKSYEFLAQLAESQVDEISIEAAQPQLDLSVLAELSNKHIALGVLDHSTQDAESVSVVASRIHAALRYVKPERLLPAPDCGMKYMTREMAFARLSALSAAAGQIRQALTAHTD